MTRKDTDTSLCISEIKIFSVKFEDFQSIAKCNTFSQPAIAKCKSCDR